MELEGDILGESKYFRQGLVVDVYGIKNLTDYDKESFILTSRPCKISFDTCPLVMKPIHQNLLIDHQTSSKYFLKLSKVKYVSATRWWNKFMLIGYYYGHLGNRHSLMNLFHVFISRYFGKK